MFVFLINMLVFTFYIYYYLVFLQDPISQRQHATRIRFLPKGSVSFETISTKRHVGVISREAPERALKSPSKTNRYDDLNCFVLGSLSFACNFVKRP